MARGTLVLVVGPSGVGKDSLIAHVRGALAGDGDSVPPPGSTPRAAGDAAEAHAPLDEARLGGMVAPGAFALHWRAHGLGYGIPASIAGDLAAGRHVVANVSRAVIPDARRRFPPVRVVSVTAPAALLAERLANRGRESGEGIESRLDRAALYAVDGPGVVVLDNAGPIAEAGGRFLALLRRL